MKKPSIKQLVLDYAKEYGFITHALMGGHEQKQFKGFYMGTDESIGKRCRELFKDKLMMRGDDKDGYAVYWPKAYGKPSTVVKINPKDHRYIYGEPEVTLQTSPSLSGENMVAGSATQRLFNPPIVTRFNH